MELDNTWEFDFLKHKRWKFDNSINFGGKQFFWPIIKLLILIEATKNYEIYMRIYSHLELLHSYKLLTKLNIILSLPVNFQQYPKHVVKY